MTEWISVKDRMPKPVEDVLVYDGNSVSRAWHTPEGYWDRHTRVGWSSFDEDCDTTTISHWMPLPDPPEVTADDSLYSESSSHH